MSIARWLGIAENPELIFVVDFAVIASLWETLCDGNSPMM
jgi:hypothetical protein